jgi:hypothetical protein
VRIRGRGRADGQTFAISYSEANIHWTYPRRSDGPGGAVQAPLGLIF